MRSNRPTFEKSVAFTAELERIVPGGAHTYSKGRDSFPQPAPSGIRYGKGARVTDIDGNAFIDWSMGLASVSLGHAHPEVNRAVCDAIELGVNFQRPAELELETARAFIDFAGVDMVKFARHGSVVNTAAVKLARAYTGRAKVAVPREHPFFSFDDWFIGSTAADFGIPPILKSFTLQFSYNDIDSLHALFSANAGEIACVMLEAAKFDPPKDDFLHKVQELCRKNGALFIVDEMITGLKFAVPGASKYFDLDPDISTWGKGIANGFSATALAGRGDIMRLGSIEPEGQRKLFLLSTTHGAENVGLAAMRKTLELFADGKLVAANWVNGERLKARLDAIIASHRLQDFLRLKGYPCFLNLEALGPKGEVNSAFRTLFLQEMIQRGILFQGLFFPTPSHGAEEFAETESAFAGACEVYRSAIDQGSAEGLLLGPPVKPVFRAKN